MSIENLSETSVETPEVTETVEVETPELSGDERWEAIDLSAKLTPEVEEAEEATETEDKPEATDDDDRDETEDELSPSAPLPDEEAEASDIEDEEPDLADVTASEGKPTQLSRRKLREVEKNVINPFRDPETPINEVLHAFEQFHPTRTHELRQAIVNESARQSPNEWVQALTGIPEITVEKVKELVERESQLPQVETANDTETIKEYLTTYYGDSWQDPANDEALLVDDRKFIAAFRRQVELENTTKEKDSVWQQKFDSVQKELESLKPQIESFEQARQAEEARIVDTTYQNSVNEYRSKIEQKSLPKLFTDLNLTPNEADTDSVKEVKDFIKARFNPVYGEASDFDLYMTNEFSARETVGKIIHRVDNLLRNAAVAEAKAKSSASQADAARHASDASALKNQALMEQDAMTVLARKAAQEFLSSSHVAPVMKVLEENADLQRRLNANGRVETIGSAALPNGNGWRDDLKESEDKWNPEFIAKRLSNVAR